VESKIDDQLLALEGAFNALLVTLHEAGTLNADRYRVHLRGAANQLDEGALPEAAAALDVLRAHLDVLLPQRSTQAAGS